MEKRVYGLLIDPELEALVAKPSDAEQAVLCESLDKYGCLDELTTWRGFILDGHTRYRHCVEKGIPFAYRELEFDSKEEAKLWILELSLGRRSLTKYQRTKLALRYEEVWKEEAERRMRAGVDPVPLGAQGHEKGKTRDKVAKMAGVGHNYVDRVKRLEAEADEETRQKLERDEITVGAAIRKLDGKNTEEKPEDAVAKGTEAAGSPAGKTEEAEGEAEEGAEPETGSETLRDYYGFNGKRHTGSPYPDVPDSYPMVEEELDRLIDNYLTNMKACLDRFTKGIQTLENKRMFQKAIREAHKEANAMMKEAFGNE